jgi:hypothetical protein
VLLLTPPLCKPCQCKCVLEDGRVVCAGTAADAGVPLFVRAVMSVRGVLSAKEALTLLRPLAPVMAETGCAFEGENSLGVAGDSVIDSDDAEDGADTADAAAAPTRVAAGVRGT